MLKSLKRQKLHESVTEEVLKFIEANAYSQGDRLPSERFFCEQFQISRTSFREAMKRLESYGIIEIRPGSGMYLKSERTLLGEMTSFKLHFAVEKKSILEMLDLREVLEKYAIDQIVRQKQTSALEQLNRILDEYDRKIEKGEVPRHEDFLFHRTLYEGSNNSLLPTLFSSMKDMETLWADRVIKTVDKHVFGRETEPLHRQIYTAMADGDAKTAKRLMGRHFDLLRSDLDHFELEVFPDEFPST